jgi:hypothetical protein
MPHEPPGNKFGFVLLKDKGIKRNTTILRNTIKRLETNKENDDKLKKQLEEKILADETRGNGNAIFDGKLTTHLIPSNENIDIGSETNKFRSLYVSAKTIFVGNSSIGSTDDGGLQFPSNIQIGESSISTTTEGLKFPSSIQIGESTISTSTSGNLTLPDTFKVGNTEISTKDGGFKVGELDLAALKIQGAFNVINDITTIYLERTIKPGDTFIFGNDLYIALIDNAKVEATDWRKIEVKGSQGIQGEKGDKGDQGIQGIQGFQGDKGEQGIQGIQGEKGEQGFDGSEAADEAQRQASQAKIAAETAKIAAETAQIAAETAKTEALEAVSIINNMKVTILHLQNVVEHLCQQFYRKTSEEVLA